MKLLINIIIVLAIVVALFAVIFSLFVYIIYYIVHDPNTVTFGRELILQKEYKIIFLYTPLHGEYSFWEEYFRKILLGQCPESFCRLTANESELPSADAVLFSASDLQPRMTADDRRKIFAQRNQSQLWIIFRMDPPSRIEASEIIVKNYKNVFNLTMSYESSSDIVSPFGQFIPKERLRNQNPFLVEVNGRPFDVSSEDFLSRPKFAVVFLPQCDDDVSKRHQEIIKELNKYIEIDVFNMKCNMREEHFITMNDYFNGNYSGLVENTISDYYFVLVLQDDVCPDYLTELFYLPLLLGSVPVLLKAPPLTDALRLPFNSFVNSHHFDDLKELANHLTQVSKNKPLYLRYHAWRQDYSVRVDFPFEPQPCDLCSRLHQRREYKLYEDLGPWLSPKKCKIL